MQRWGSLKLERSSFISHWQDISQHLLPYSGRFLLTDRNRGEKRFNKIYDSTGTRSLRILAAGLMAGMTSPARPWFRLATPDKDLMEFGPVKLWLNSVTEMMRDIFSRSNTYRALHTLYEELGAFNTAVTIMEPNFDHVVHHTPLTCGEYAIATNDLGQVTTLYREFEMQVQQIVKQFVLQGDGSFDWSAVSVTVKNMYDTHKLDAWVPVIHGIEPRTDRDTTKRDAKNMPFMSCYFESGSNEDKLLRESGYKRFPALAPRWSVSGGDVYGNGPGMEALGDIKQLQHEQLRKAQGIDYKTKPPLQMPTALKNTPVATLPGGVAHVDTSTQGGGIRPMFEVNLDLQHLLLDIQDVRKRINESFYADLFLMLAQDTRSNVTAREIAERHEEKLLMLGPVLERLHNELLKPMIDLVFDYAWEAGIVPPPPPELAEQELNVEFVSTLAQAQRAVATGQIDRLLGTVGAMAQFKPEVLDKLDGDEIVDQYADALGVNPSLIVPDDKVKAIREEKAAAMAKQQQLAMAPEAAKTAKTLSETNVTDESALTKAIGMFSGY